MIESVKTDMLDKAPPLTSDPIAEFLTKSAITERVPLFDIAPPFMLSPDILFSIKTPSILEFPSLEIAPPELSTTLLFIKSDFIVD